MKKYEKNFKLIQRQSKLQPNEQQGSEEEINTKKSHSVINLSKRIIEKKKEEQHSDRIRTINNILEYAESLDW
jgi:hypothetical protein